MVAYSLELHIATERWKNPCGATSTDFPTPLRPQQSIILDLIRRLNEGITRFGNLTRSFASQRIRSKGTIAYLQGQHQPGFDVEENDDHDYNIIKVHLSSFRSLSKAAIFLEQVKHDEDNQENGAFSSEIIYAETKLYDILCHVEMAIDQLRIGITEYESRDIMAPETRAPTPKIDRYERDYVIVKDIELTLRSVLVKTQGVRRLISGS